MTSTDTNPSTPQPSAAGTSPTGEFVTLDGDEMYVIRNYDRMPGFLMSIVSDSDHWMYVSTRGGLAAGRVSPDRSLFPYETDDRLYRASGSTGPFTMVRIAVDDGPPVVWEPFSERSRRPGVIRNLYKSLAGNSVVFEEAAPDLGLVFRYRWNTSSTYGFIRTSTLMRSADSTVDRVGVVDGLLNLMPAGVPLGLQQTSSTLVEAYRRNELDPQTGMAIYSLESRITDRAEPAESMFANTVWSLGLGDPAILLTADQVSAFRNGEAVESERVTKGLTAHYLLSATVEFDTTDSVGWRIVADVHQSQLDVESRRAQILGDTDLDRDLTEHIAAGTDRLRALIDSADGSQSTGDAMATAHHFANTLFNAMRGGVFVDNGAVPVADLKSFLDVRNRPTRRAHAEWLANLGDTITLEELLHRAEKTGDPDLVRLCHEYLPLTFSRRHGDPSRPWNQFAIRVRDDDGNRILDYQGNWRDIFQNWEALCYSYPEYLESIIAKFVNASTVDGFNPYRVTRQGIDWEVPDLEDPWSNIGYWGDHQIVYLLRLLEASEAFYPGALHKLLNREVFSYANVPYRLRSYDAIVRNSKSTIDFDERRERDIQDRIAIIGSDGRLVLGHDGNVLHVTMAEKLLVPALAKLANLVVEAGIWLNTQRPEWNDANNALVGYGASMVTLAYLRRYLEFCERLFAEHAATEYVVSSEVAEWLNETTHILLTYIDRLEQPSVSDRRRKRILDNVAYAFAAYRGRVYDHGFSGKATVASSTIADLCRAGRLYAEHSIRANRRESGLYHSYNLVHFEHDGREIRVEHLSEMLEGQVAVLSSGVLTPDEILEVVEALYTSRLYREDQDSFMLYPAEQLPSFLERNTIAAADVDANPLLGRLVENGETTLIVRDAFGVYRFVPAITSVERLTEALDHLSSDPAWTDLVAAHRGGVYQTFENVFHHERFTGRSGSMYKYEGLGSIYWHMVSKLLLAVQENYWSARRAGIGGPQLEALAEAYYRVRAGLSSDKTPVQYGAFPMDPYSHSPGHMGAQQPGMTGQVKEEVLTRWGELGVQIAAGTVRFEPVLLRRREFLEAEALWKFVDMSGNYRKVDLPPNSLGFTYCQVPIVYHLVDGEAQVRVTASDGTTSEAAGNSLDAATSQALFSRDGSIAAIDVDIPASMITLA